MKSVEVFDPAMCCSSGVCGPNIDPNLLRAARDLAWLKHQPDIEVKRYNLAQEPAAFVGNAAVAAELRSDPEVLPLVLIDGEIVARGTYPSREEFCALLGIAPPVLSTGLKVVSR